jgi:hypothetical protein
VTEAEARALIESMVDASADPVLTSDELDRLVALAKRPDAAGNLPGSVDGAATWEASTSYSIGDIVTADPAGGRWWVCVVPGTSDATDPIWPDITGVRNSAQVSDGQVRWMDAGGTWVPTWDLDLAAAHGWELKAGKVAGRFDFTTDGQTFRRGQLLDHARTMSKMYRRKRATVG